MSLPIAPLCVHNRSCYCRGCTLPTDEHRECAGLHAPTRSGRLHVRSNMPPGVAAHRCLQCHRAGLARARAAREPAGRRGRRGLHAPRSRAGRDRAGPRFRVQELPPCHGAVEEAARDGREGGVGRPHLVQAEAPAVPVDWIGQPQPPYRFAPGLAAAGLPPDLRVWRARLPLQHRRVHHDERHPRPRDVDPLPHGRARTAPHAGDEPECCGARRGPRWQELCPRMTEKHRLQLRVTHAVPVYRGETWRRDT